MCTLTVIPNLLAAAQAQLHFRSCEIVKEEKLLSYYRRAKHQRRIYKQISGPTFLFLANQISKRHINYVHHVLYIFRTHEMQVYTLANFKQRSVLSKTIYRTTFCTFQYKSTLYSSFQKHACLLRTLNIVSLR